MKSQWRMVKEGNTQWWEIRGKDCVITVEKRPPYCDRGNFVAKIQASGVLARDLDSQDQWPRYYFRIENSLDEVELWLRKRNQYQK